MRLLKIMGIWKIFNRKYRPAYFKNRRLVQLQRQFCWYNFILLCIVSVILLFCLLNHVFSSIWDTSAIIMLLQNYLLIYLNDKSSDPVCRFIKLDPSNPIVKELFVRKAPIVCSETYEEVMTVSNNGKLNWNKESSMESITCSVQDMISTQKPKGKVIGAPTHFPYKLQGDYVKISCHDSKNNVKIDDVLLNPTANKKNGKLSIESDEKYSVLVLYLDGLSVLAFKKHLEKTIPVLNSMNFIHFESFNKVGLNSFPNAIPALTGKRPYSDDVGMDSEFEFRNHVEKIPMVFDNFTENGYVTVFNEDCVNVGLFHWHRAIKNLPTDYYYYNYYKELLNITTLDEELNFDQCIRGKPPFQHFLDVITTHYQKNPNELKMIYSFSCISHHEDYNGDKADQHLADFFAKAHSTGMFNSTVVFLLSDHGPRMYGTRKNTIIGAYEGSLPFLSVYLPQTFQQSFPIISESLKSNSVKQRLVTPFDLYETWQDLALSNFNSSQRTIGSRGLSLFYPINANRTCLEAGIPVKYCACLDAVWVKINPLELHTMSNASIRAVVRADGMTYYRIQLAVVQKNAIYEAILFTEHQNETSAWRRNTDTDENTARMFNKPSEYTTRVNYMNRVDRYGTQAHCINDEHLRMFCICNDVL